MEVSWAVGVEDGDQAKSFQVFQDGLAQKVGSIGTLYGLVGWGD